MPYNTSNYNMVTARKLPFILDSETVSAVVGKPHKLEQPPFDALNFPLDNMWQIQDSVLQIKYLENYTFDNVAIGKASGYLQIITFPNLPRFARDMLLWSDPAQRSNAEYFFSNVSKKHALNYEQFHAGIKHHSCNDKSPMRDKINTLTNQILTFHVARAFTYLPQDIYLLGINSDNATSQISVFHESPNVVGLIRTQLCNLTIDFCKLGVHVFFGASIKEQVIFLHIFSLP